MKPIDVRSSWMRSGRALAAVLLCGVTVTAAAHSASDAYVTLDMSAATGSTTTVRVQWDIALRDLDFVMKLDDDGDGHIVWKELRRHQQEIARYALAHIGFQRNGKACGTRLAKQLVDNHADGAYAALFIDVACTGPATPMTLDYRLFFAIDPSHRAILVSRNGGDVATALLSPQNARVELKAGTTTAPAR
jgi:hypothetical protein